MDVEYTYKSDVMNPLIYDVINNSVSMNRTGNDSLLSQERWIRPWYIYALFIALIILSLSLNAVVIIVCIRAKLRKHPTNLYFLNLAIGDSGIALSMIFYLHNMDVPWTDGTCKLYLFFQKFTTIFSLNTLLLVAVERFIAVRIPMKFQAFTTQRCILYQLCFLWLSSTVLVLYPSITTPVRVNNGCYDGLSIYNLALFLPPIPVMFTIYISILIKLRQRHKRSRSRIKEADIKSEYACALPMRKLNEMNVSDAVSVVDDVRAKDNIGTERELCDIDTAYLHSHNNTLTSSDSSTDYMTPSSDQLAGDIIYRSNPRLNRDGTLVIPSANISLIHPNVSNIEHSTDPSVDTSANGSKNKKIIHSSPKQKTRTSIDQRNKKAIILVLSIFLLMIVCHTGIVYTIIYATIFDLGQEYIYRVGDVIVLPYVVHTCITPVLQLRFNDVVRQGLPARFHQARSPSS